MKRSVFFLLFSSLLVTVAGCAASSDEAPVDGDENDLTRRPRIEISSQNDPNAVPARLAKLLDTFKDESFLGIVSGIESSSHQMSGKEGRLTRSVTCSTDDMELVSPGGGGFQHRTTTNCQLDGFERTRAGGQLPNMIVNFETPATLAVKLTELLRKGAEQGGLGVTKTGGGPPQCCDIPTTTTYEIKDANSSLVCKRQVGGFAAMTRVECTFSRTIAPNQ